MNGLFFIILTEVYMFINETECCHGLTVDVDNDGDMTISSGDIDCVVIDKEQARVLAKVINKWLVTGVIDNYEYIDYGNLDA